MSNIPDLLPVKDNVCDELELDTDCLVTAVRPDRHGVRITVTLTGTMTVPEYAARELLKQANYTIGDMLLDLFLPRWVTPFKMTASRRVRNALTGVKTTFDDDMTHTLR